MESEQPAPVCKNVFKNGENTTSAEALTKIWITLINKLERSKSEGFV